ncbi:MAG: hypothetical protein VX988_12265 [Planctomycetota bacterium]|nr:hypothetical protein [Planctomycetota bacterium]
MNFIVDGVCLDLRKMISVVYEPVFFEDAWPLVKITGIAYQAGLEMRNSAHNVWLYLPTGPERRARG